MSFLCTILANKSNPYGIARDIEVVRRGFGGQGGQIRVCDPLEPPSYSDLAIHLEVPVYGWMPWSARNVLVVNPEWFVAAWEPLLGRFDWIWCKDGVTLAEFQGRFPAIADRFTLMPWAATPRPTAFLPVKTVAPLSALWMLGASKNKHAFVPKLLAAWKETYPHLLITTATGVDLSGISVSVPPNVSVRSGDLDQAARDTLMKRARIHICCSAAEGFGFTAAEAEEAGAFTILNRLPVYEQDYGGISEAETAATGVAWLEDGLDAAMVAADAWTAEDARKRQTASKARWESLQSRLAAFVKPFLKEKRPAGLKFLPPRLDHADCPPISIVTLLHNRRKFFDLACHSIMCSDYPKDKIEWVIVDDSDDPAEQVADRVVAVSEKSAPLKMVYVPLARKTPIGAKRNMGCDRASNEIILMMDDDDHYPETSFRRRVGWLTGHPWKPKAVACTTIACYDLQRGISSVNVPPAALPLSQRISEATLTFYKSWWSEGAKFPVDVHVGEGEELLRGREHEFMEIPPQQIIVAFGHGRNVSSRRVPAEADVKPGCFWGFPKEFLVFVHGLAGVKVEQA